MLRLLILVAIVITQTRSNGTRWKLSTSGVIEPVASTETIPSTDSSRGIAIVAESLAMRRKFQAAREDPLTCAPFVGTSPIDHFQAVRDRAFLRMGTDRDPTLDKVFDRHGGVAKVATLLRNAIVTVPSANVYHEASTYWRVRGELPYAIECLRQALALNPQHGEAHVNFARLLLFAGRFEEAESVLNLAAKLESTPAFLYHYTMGGVLESRDSMSLAAHEYRNALLAEPNFPLAVAALRRVGDNTSHKTTASMHQSASGSANTLQQQANDRVASAKITHRERPSVVPEWFFFPRLISSNSSTIAIILLCTLATLLLLYYSMPNSSTDSSASGPNRSSTNGTGPYRTLPKDSLTSLKHRRAHTTNGNHTNVITTTTATTTTTTTTTNNNNNNKRL